MSSNLAAGTMFDSTFEVKANSTSNSYGRTYSPEQLRRECWYAVYTRTRHEKSVAEQCKQRDVATFLPLYCVQRRWKQRRAKVLLPLFPSYVFVRIALRDRLRVLGIPGIVSIVSFRGVPAGFPGAPNEFLFRGVLPGRGHSAAYLLFRRHGCM